MVFLRNTKYHSHVIRVLIMFFREHVCVCVCFLFCRRKIKRKQTFVIIYSFHNYLRFDENVIYVIALLIIRHVRVQIFQHV